MIKKKVSRQKPKDIYIYAAAAEGTCDRRLKTRCELTEARVTHLTSSNGYL